MDVSVVERKGVVVMSNDVLKETGRGIRRAIVIVAGIIGFLGLLYFAAVALVLLVFGGVEFG